MSTFVYYLVVTFASQTYNRGFGAVDISGPYTYEVCEEMKNYTRIQISNTRFLDEDRLVITCKKTEIKGN